MVVESLSPTREFAAASQPLSLGQLTAVQVRSLVFYTVERFDFATRETLGAYLRRAEELEDEKFSQSAVKSAPRSWREL